MMQEMEERYFRPPSEAKSFIIRVIHGCPHNKCTFCNMFKTIQFRPIPLQEILAGIDQDVQELEPDFVAYIKSIYLEGGDPLVLRTETLLRIMEHARKRFPSVTRFACYTTARFTVQKKNRKSLTRWLRPDCNESMWGWNPVRTCSSKK